MLIGVVVGLLGSRTQQTCGCAPAFAEIPLPDYRRHSARQVMSSD